MKRLVIVHGWDGFPEECWFPWLKKESEKAGFNVFVPQMPQPDAPHIDRWVPHLAKTVGKPDDKLVLVGHSAGCITILRYMETLPKEAKVGRVVLVAGFTDNLGFKELDNYFQRPIDWNKIKSHCSSFVSIYSDNDQYVPVKHADVFRKNLGARMVAERGKNHMGGSDNVTELQSALDAVLKG
jgi:predicted alpha/beta hydrolase family esterase